MKILLLNPPAVSGVQMVREGRCMQRQGAWTAVWAPITLTTMAAMLDSAGFQTQVIDAIVENIDTVKLKEILKKTKPDMVVINTSTPSIESDLSVSSLAKRFNRSVTTVAFGIHVSALPEESFKLGKDLDVIIRGEPELTLLELAKVLQNKGSLNKVEGISIKNNKRVIHNPDRVPVKELDSLPFPAWEKIDVMKYKLPFTNEPFLLVDTGRGCPYSCKFCAAATFYGKKVRLPTFKRVVDELEYDLKKFNVSNFLFWTESFAANKDFSEGVCKEILRRKLSIRWVCNSRVDTVDLAQLKLFKKAGCWMIGFGIESGSDAILNLMAKGVKVSQIKKAVKIAKQAELEVTAHTILGYPGETQTSARQTIDLIKELDVDFAQFYLAVPFPGSKLYQEACREGFINTWDWSRFEQNFSVMDLPNLTSREAERLRNLAYRRFYLRPKMIVKILGRLRSPREWWGFFQMSKDFLGWIR